MWKVKRIRTIDCVVIGYREGKEPEHRRLADPGAHRRRRPAGADGPLVGLLGQAEARRCSTWCGRTRRASAASGEVSRWTQGRELEWVGLRPELVVEVSFDHASGGRIRHGARLHRFRDDKRPDQCLLADFSAAETAVLDTGQR